MRHAVMSTSQFIRRPFSVASFPFLEELCIQDTNKGVYNGTWFGNGETFTSVNPSTKEPIASIQTGTVADYEKCIVSMEQAKKVWSETPAPLRGEIVRQIGQALREKQSALGSLIALEMGKIYVEGVGEVQVRRDSRSVLAIELNSFDTM